MESRLKICAMIVGLIFGLCAFAGSAMAGNPLEDLLNKVQSDFKAINDKGEQDRARIRGEAQTGGAQNSGIAMAAQPDTSQSKPTQLITPKDKRVAAAMDEALPIIKKMLSIHQCIQEPQSLRQLNVFAVPGVDMIKNSGNLPAYGFPNSQFFMKYHDRNKCVRVSKLDQWTMPALNALLFRAVYFADDSGETVNFLYLFKRADDGSWKIAQLEKD